MTIPDLHDPGFFPDDFPVQGQRIEREGMRKNIPCRRKDGEIFYCDTTSGMCQIDGVPHIIGYFYDLTEKNKKLSPTPRERELFSSGPVATFVWLPEEGWPVAYVSDNIKGILGYGSDELMSDGIRFADMVHPDDLDRVQYEVSFNSTTGEDIFDQSYRLRHRDGHYVWVYDFTRFIRDDKGKISEIHGYMFDQTRLKEAESEILHQKERLSGIIAGTNMGTWEWNVQTGETIFNEQWAAIAGYSLEELSPVSIKTWENLSHPDDLKLSNAALKEHFAGKTEYYSIELRMKHKNGSWIWVHDKGRVIEWSDDGRALWMFGTHQDFTERKRNETLVHQQLEEKEILLREVHHRIKNNMNSVSSLLKLQAGMADPDGSRAINKAIGRLEGMRVLYEKLLMTDEYKEIAVKPYVEDLIRSIVDLFPEKKWIDIDVSIDDLQMNTKKIFPLGLILNELITNSMKYAFGPREEGRIRVDLSRHENGEVVLTVCDNGRGLPQGFDLDSNSGFGLKLVKMLAKQLGGLMTIDDRDGVFTEIRCCGHDED